MAALREQWQAQRQQRQENAAKRRQAVQAHLNALHRDRLDHVAALCEQLSQQEQHRQTQAQQTRIELEDYTSALQEMVQQMQAQLQEQRIALHLEAEALRSSQCQERITAGQNLRQDLADYVKTLKADVAQHLAEATAFLEGLSPQRQQVTATNREHLHREVDALFADLARFRQQLAADRVHLQQVVWGTTPFPSSVDTAVKTPTQSPARQARRPKSSKVKASADVSPPAPKTEPTAAPEISIEEQVYTHLQGQASGARLTEIESGLEINRFQAVDALRSLIQKELVIQKDRTYYIHEDSTL